MCDGEIVLTNSTSRTCVKTEQFRRGACLIEIRVEFQPKSGGAPRIIDDIIESSPAAAQFPRFRAVRGR